MRGAVRIVACGAVASVLASCSAVDFDYYRGGIGTNLYTADIPAATELQNTYLNYLCRQSSPVVAPGGDDRCGAEIPHGLWPLIVQAGMNDIDQRCDAYLAWLDEKRRTNAAIVEELGIIRGAADLLFNASFGTSPHSLAALASVFALATGTFTKLSSFLLQAEQSTVMSVVLGRRKKFREEVRAIQINHRPNAIHALRSYLLICMPMTIVTDINSTVTIYQQGGTEALNARQVIGSTSTIGLPAKARDPAGPGQQSKRPPIEHVAEYAGFISNYNTNEFPQSTVIRMQNALCVPSTEVGRAGTTIMDQIAIFKASDMVDDADNKMISAGDPKLTASEKTVLLKFEDCPRQFAKNFYERTRFLTGTTRNLKANIREIVDAMIVRLNRVEVPGQAAIPKGTRLDATRGRIRAVRDELKRRPEIAKELMGVQIRDLPPAMRDQWSPDLFDLLGRMQDRNQP